MNSVLKPPYFSSTLKFEDFGTDAHRIDNLPYVSPAPHSLLDEFRMMFCILKEARKVKALLLNSSNGRLYPDVLACIVLGFLPKRYRPAIALVGDMWQPNPGARGLIERIVITLADRAIDRYLLYSTEEMESFPKFWGVSRDKMRVQPYYATLSEKERNEPIPASKGHIFAGGNSHRDYAPLVEAARQLPDIQFILATRRLEQVQNPPSNVKAGPVSHQEFMDLMRTAAAVVVPMKQGLQRSTGQQTYLNAMYLKRPVIVNKAFAVNEHIKNGENGLVVDGSAQGYADAIRWILDPKNAAEVAQISENAHQTVANNFLPSHYVKMLIDAMKELRLATGKV